MSVFTSSSPSRKPLFVAVTSVSVLLLSRATAEAAWTVEEKSIADLSYAYTSGLTTAVDVVQQYLDRIATYNKGAPGLNGGINAVAEVNANAIADAARIDALIAGGASAKQYPLLGVPVLLKNSIDSAGLTTTNGVSVLNGVGPAGSTKLIAPNDSFTAARLKEAGAIIIGKAAQSTMAYSFNGIDNANGLVLNPYQPKRQPGGSSSGSGAGVASNFAMLAIGGETGGSIRIPSNANALVGLKTSIGLIDPGGSWPLTPSRDVLGPMAKNVADVAVAMNALVAPSSKNLFNDTPPYNTSNPGTVRPADYASFLDANALRGKVVAVPKYMVNQSATPNNYDGTVSPVVLNAFNDAISDIRAQGATVVYVDIPASDKYYYTLGRNAARAAIDPVPGTGATTIGFGYDYPTTTSGGTTPASAFNDYAAAYYYNEQIKSYGNSTVKNIRDFADLLKATVDAGGAGDSRSSLGARSVNSSGVVSYSGAAGNMIRLADIVDAGLAAGFDTNPDAVRALQAFSDLRLAEYEGFMDNPNLADDPTTPFDESTITKIDTFAAPTYGGIMPLATSVNPAGTVDEFAGGFASLMGRFEVNILGVPSINVPMGYASDGTPMGLQFFNKLLGEGDLLGYAYDYEQATKWRVAPDLSFVLVPEPATLLAAGLSAILLRRRRMTA